MLKIWFEPIRTFSPTEKQKQKLVPGYSFVSAEGILEIEKRRIKGKWYDDLTYEEKADSQRQVEALFRKHNGNTEELKKELTLLFNLSKTDLFDFEDYVGLFTRENGAANFANVEHDLVMLQGCEVRVNIEIVKLPVQFISQEKQKEVNINENL
jgi:hypothetical protein